MPEQNDALNTVGDRMVMFFKGEKGGRSNQIGPLLVVFIPKLGGRCKPLWGDGVARTPPV